ncbi:MAG TPA: OB-fold nucleic acid binding domain-containing protein, partial [Chitinophagales bacterium]|nr:OB-fold nucleic acid binding domain-containing protein [Chitinophagales bacterium]
MQQLSEQEIIRREKLEKIKELGINPYPAALYPVNAYSAEIKENYKEEILEDGTKNRLNFQEVCIAGRLMATRPAGKATFAELQDSQGRIQIYIRRDDICPGDDKSLYDTVFSKLMDLGDFIGIKGYAFKTKVGEISVHATELVLLAKSLHPLPVVKVDSEGNTHDAFTDPELRYRMRYVDLIVN